MAWGWITDKNLGNSIRFNKKLREKLAEFFVIDTFLILCLSKIRKLKNNRFFESIYSREKKEERKNEK